MKWVGGFDDFAQLVVDSAPPEEIERALRFAWYLQKVEECTEFTAQDIAELFQRAHISKPNVSRLAQRLASTRRTFRGSTAGRFRLTLPALTELDEEFEGALDNPSEPTNTLIVRLEEKLQTLTDLHVHSFVREAVSCLRSGHLRAAVVLSWIGAVAVLQHYVASNRLVDFNLDAKSNGLLKKDVRGVSDLSRVKESDFLDCIERIGVLSNAVKKELLVCLGRRNNCGHPNDYVATEAAVVAHIESLIVHVFERY